jgi:hypothetical protein
MFQFKVYWEIGLLKFGSLTGTEMISASRRIRVEKRTKEMPIKIVIQVAFLEFLTGRKSHLWIGDSLEGGVSTGLNLSSKLKIANKRPIKKGQSL